MFQTTNQYRIEDLWPQFLADISHAQSSVGLYIFSKIIKAKILGPRNDCQCLGDPKKYLGPLGFPSRHVFHPEYGC